VLVAIFTGQSLNTIKAIIPARMHACTHAHARARAHTHTHTHTQTVLIDVFAGLLLNKMRREYSHTHAHTRTHTHTHAHTRTPRPHTPACWCMCGSARTGHTQTPHAQHKEHTIFPPPLPPGYPHLVFVLPLPSPVLSRRIVRGYRFL